MNGARKCMGAGRPATDGCEGTAGPATSLPVNFGLALTEQSKHDGTMGDTAMTRILLRARQLFRRVKRVVDPPMHKPGVNLSFDVLGSEYGRWPVLSDTIVSTSLVYSFGVGRDVSFDLALIDLTGCTVFAFDPTPRCREWVSTQDLPDRFRFYPVGLHDRSTTLSFSAPDREDFVSYTIGARAGNAGKVDLPVKALDEILSDLDHGGRVIDLLKMDIEGSEYSALPQMAKAGVLPLQLSVEFHHGMFGYSKDDTRRTVALLREEGYEIFYVSENGREYGFVRTAG